MKIRTLRTYRFMRSNFFDLLICIAIALVLVLLSSGAAFAQHVGINNPTPHTKALLDVTSTEKGVLITRMSAAQRIAMFPVADPTAKGMLVYQTDAQEGFHYYDGAQWIFLDPAGATAPAPAGWALEGNAGTDPANDFVGTTDARPVVLRTANTERMRVGETGNVGIGTNAPASRLQVRRGDPGYAPNNNSALTVEGTGATYASILSNTGETGLLFGVNNDAQHGGLIYNPAFQAGSLMFRTGGNNTRMTVAGNGSVTVGNNMAWPDYRFSVVSPNANSAAMAIRNMDNTGISGAHYFGSGGTLAGLTGWMNGGVPLAPGTLAHGTITNTPATFVTNSAERMRITANGDVGIGITNPTHRLQVQDDRQDAVGRFRNLNANGWSGVQFDAATGAGRAHIGYGNATSGALANVGYAGTTSNHPFVFTTVDVERMRIQPNGHVGVGTQTPTARLDISLNSTIAQPQLRLSEIGDDFARIAFSNDQTAKFWQIAGLPHENDDIMALNFFHSSGVNLMSLRGNGNLGIGTVNPAHGLHVLRTTDNATLGLRNLNDNAVGGVNYYGSGGTLGGVTGWSNNGNAIAPGSLLHGTFTNTPLTFISNNTERMRILANGRVGIGTSTPAGQVEVSSNSGAGTGQVVLTETELDHARLGMRNTTTTKFWELTALAHATDASANFNVYHSVAGNLLTVRGNGNVGIGAPNPTTKLEVNGFTKLGSDAPAVRMKKFVINVPATADNSISVPHGIDQTKVIGIQATLDNGGVYIPMGTALAGFSFNCFVSGANVIVSTPSTGSANTLGRPVRILITYEE